MAPQDRRMTTRARWYLIIGGVRHMLSAAAAIWMADRFTSATFKPLLAAAPLWLWAALFTGAGVVCCIGAMTRRPKIARLGLMWSATSTLMVAVGLVVAYFTGDLASPWVPIAFAALAAKDFTVCADPLRSPFEDWVEEIAAAEDAAEEEAALKGGAA